ncbi:collagen-like protein [Fibrella sp. HMF5335]|uniref:Collagen-like protein n=1 Tax=Fibrella rubiginis TaxID=2817060 RepID=A0A939GGR6_9BACT|nr:collagen-like protein [Fibrella rubiginis]MBO0936197.1 collagen-like protein [Fibrella rubiginis]
MRKLVFLSSFFAGLAIVTSLWLASCKGEVGPAGATGPAGPAGPAGAAGATGPAGASGASGVSSVIQYSFTARTWAATVGAQQTFSFTGVSDQVAAASTFACYIAVPSSNTAINSINWFQVPGVIRINDGSNNFDYGDYNTWLNTANGRSPVLAVRRESVGTSGALTAAVRIIMVPANDLRNGGRKAAVDFKDYNAVKAFYHLPD